MNLILLFQKYTYLRFTVWGFHSKYPRIGIILRQPINKNKNNFPTLILNFERNHVTKKKDRQTMIEYNSNGNYPLELYSIPNN